MKQINLIVTSTFGLEAVLKRELLDFGFNGGVVSDGKIEFPATVDDIPTLNIKLRTADRVLLKLGEFRAVDFGQLFDQTQVLPWEDWITREAKITVIGKSVKSTLQSVRSAQSIVKKAIVERLKEKFKIDWLPETGVEYTIQVAVLKDVVQLTLDTSGLGLHKRGYRTGVGEAPMRENLAAALVLLSSWNKEKLLVDPMCGSGTILIEAAMIARNISPGWRREFAAESWPAISPKAWEDARLAARQAILPSASPVKIFGYDIDEARIEDCRKNAKRAGVDQDIIFERQDIRDLSVEQTEGVMISNPPYGVNVGNPKELPALYKAVSRNFSEKKDWALYVLTADKKFPDLISRSRPDQVRKLFNGTIEVNYYQYRTRRN
jgi:putative N6-adenine-specific DNA methylase